MTATLPLEAPAVPHLTVIAHGTPAPQGSKRLGRNRKTGAPLLLDDSRRTAPWRESVAWAGARARELAGITEPLTGPLRVVAVFTMPKPVSAPKRRRTWPSRKPDVDKLQRSTFDAFTTAGVWVDDAQVVDVRAIKTFPGEHDFALSAPGVHVRIWQVSA